MERKSIYPEIRIVDLRKIAQAMGRYLFGYVETRKKGAAQMLDDSLLYSDEIIDLRDDSWTWN